jgi:hypothetical protein
MDHRRGDEGVDPWICRRVDRHRCATPAAASSCFGIVVGIITTVDRHLPCGALA